MTDLAEFKADYNWRAAFQEAINGCYIWGDDNDPHVINSVTHVYHCDEGENDEAEWIAIVGWKDCEIPEPFKDTPDDRAIAADMAEERGDTKQAEALRNCFAVMAAGCDYTGWD